MTARNGAAPQRKPGGGRREQKLQAAQKLFAEKGFRETSQRRRYPVGVSSPSGLPLLPVQGPFPYELIDRAGQAIATSAQSTLDADMPPANKIAEVVRNHVRQLLRNIDIVRIQFSELFKLHRERADGLRRDMSAYVRGIAKVKQGQKDGTFSTYHPRRK